MESITSNIENSSSLLLMNCGIAQNMSTRELPHILWFVFGKLCYIQSPRLCRNNIVGDFWASKEDVTNNFFIHNFEVFGLLKRGCLGEKPWIFIEPAWILNCLGITLGALKQDTKVMFCWSWISPVWVCQLQKKIGEIIGLSTKLDPKYNWKVLMKMQPSE